MWWDFPSRASRDVTTREARGTALAFLELTYWGRFTYTCASKSTIIGSDNGLSPGRCQAIIWTDAAIFIIGPLGTNFSEILITLYIFIQENAFENGVRKLAAILSRPQYVKHHIRMVSGEYLYSRCASWIENVIFWSWLGPICWGLLSQCTRAWANSTPIPRPNGLEIWLPVRTRPRVLW